jgi:hypothetical protein
MDGGIHQTRHSMVKHLMRCTKLERMDGNVFLNTLLVVPMGVGELLHKNNKGQSLWLPFFWPVV